MAGLLLIVLLGLYVWVAQKIVRRIRPTWGKAVAIVFLIGVLVVDGIYGRIKLAGLCKDQGGLRIYRTVQNVDGFYSPYVDDTFLSKHGYVFVESGATQPYIRYTRQHDGTVSRKDVHELQSIYAYRVDRGDAEDTYLVTAFRVISLRSNEVLAQVVNINYAGGWVERLMSSLTASRWSAGTCRVGYPEQVHQQLIIRTLIPSSVAR